MAERELVAEEVPKAMNRPGHTVELDAPAWQEIHLLLDFVDGLRGGRAHRRTLAQRDAEVSQLLGGMEFHPLTIAPDDHPKIIQRGRIFRKGKRPSNLKDLAAPPLENVAVGRCNLDGDRVYYASSSDTTVLAELDPEVGDDVAIISSDMVTGSSLIALPIGDLDYYRRYQRSFTKSAAAAAQYEPMLRATQSPDVMCRLLVDAFLSEQFRARASRRRDYEITSALSWHILHKFKPLDSKLPPIEGLLYPSVQFLGGMNFAITPAAFERCFKPIEVRLLTIGHVLGYGLFGWKQKSIARSFSGDGAILWEDG